MKNKLSRMFGLVLVSGFMVINLIACNTATQATGSFAQIPAGKAYAEGKEVYFIHTEVSDQQIAETLTNMMKSPVFYVPSLAAVPKESTARVFVFENGIAGDGPLGFQSDVFDNPPGTSQYSPLRRIITVKWLNNATAEILKSVDSIFQAETRGEVLVTDTGIIVNMPFMVWDGGKR